MENLERSLAEHPFMKDLSGEHVKLLAGCAKNVRYAAGEILLREGEDESQFFLIRQGTVAMEAYRPGKAPMCVETLGAGDVLGVSWVLEDDGVRAGMASTLDARARESVLAFVLDGECLRKKMSADDKLGHALSRQLLSSVYQRLARLRLQSLDVYG